MKRFRASLCCVCTQVGRNDFRETMRSRCDAARATIGPQLVGYSYVIIWCYARDGNLKIDASRVK